MHSLDLQDAVNGQTVVGSAVVLGAEIDQAPGGYACTVLDLISSAGRTRAWAWGADAALAGSLEVGDEVEVEGSVVVTHPGAAPTLSVTTLLHCDPLDGPRLEPEIYLALSLPVAAHLQRLLAREAQSGGDASSIADPEEIRGFLLFLHDWLPARFRTPLNLPFQPVSLPAA